MKKLLNTKNIILKAVWTAAAFIFVFLLWQLLAVTVFKDNKALPPPLQVLTVFFVQFSKPNFYKAVFSTLLKSVISFSIAFLLGIGLSIAAKLSIRAKYFFDPLLSILRSVPTLGVTFILLIFYPGNIAAVVIGMLVTMPLVYANGCAALNNIDHKLIDMAKVYKVKRKGQILGIYIPSSLPYIYSSVLAGFGLNLKVIVAAEIISIPRLSIGSFLNGAYTSSDFASLFSWVITAVILSFLCEAAIKLIMKISMPYKYPTRQKIISFLGKIFKRKEENVKK